MPGMQELPSAYYDADSSGTTVGSPVTIAALIFTAFCIWLIVRIVNRREKWARWTLAGAVGIPALYIASFGPACRVMAIPADDERLAFDTIPIAERPNKLAYVYWPLGRAICDSPPGKVSLFWRYARFCVPQDKCIVIPARWDGQAIVSMRGM